MRRRSTRIAPDLPLQMVEGWLMPLGNRILTPELRFLEAQAARMYSLIRPLRTGFRRIW
jgi:hypothetical protein